MKKSTDCRTQKDLNEWFADSVDELVEQYRGKEIPKKAIDFLSQELNKRSLKCAAIQIALDN